MEAVISIKKLCAGEQTYMARRPNNVGLVRVTSSPMSQGRGRGMDVQLVPPLKRGRGPSPTMLMLGGPRHDTNTHETCRVPSKNVCLHKINGTRTRYIPS